MDQEDEEDEMLELQEKVDNVLEKEEELVKDHMNLIKENA